MSEPKAPLADCEACPFLTCKFVPSSGPKQSDLVVVGEGPGGQEVLDGVPFAARARGEINAGTILWKALGDLGITREQVFVTNAVLCRPPGNRTPELKETLPCRARLEAEIASRDPKMVLMLGNTPLKVLTRTKTGITEGRLLDWNVPCAPHARGVATFHPAFLLRYGGAAIDFMIDMEKFIGRLQGTYLSPDTEGLKYAVIDTYEELEQVFGEISSPVAVDIETTGLNYHEHEIVCISMGWGKYGVVIRDLLKDPSARALLNARLNPLKQTYQNGKFDVSFLNHYGFTGLHMDDDTLLLSYALDERQGTHGLEYLAKEYLGVGDYKAEVEAEKVRLKKEFDDRKKAEYKAAGIKPPKKKVKVRTKTDGAISYGDIPETVLNPYAAKDAIYTSMLLSVLKPRLEDDTKRFYETLLLPASTAVAKMESYGVKVDAVLLEELGAQYEKDLLVLEKELQDNWGGSTFNPRSPLQVVMVLKCFNLVGPSETSSAEEVLSQIQHPFADKMLEHRGIQKKISSYINVIRSLKSRDDLVYPSYLLHGSVSRVSTKDPAIHQIPKEDTMRNLFVAPDGWEMLEADFAQHELRCCAHFSRDTFLMEVFRSDRNLHSEVASSIYGSDYTDAQYRAAKTLNFAILYGIGPKALAYRLECSIGEAAQYIEDWFVRMPQVKEFLDQERQKATTWPYELTSPFGRRRRFGLVTNQNKYDIEKKAGNWKIQGVASDITLFCLIGLTKLLDPDLARIIIFVHDALIFQVRAGQIPKVAPLIREVMTNLPSNLLKSDVPFKPDMKAGHAWGSLKAIT